MILYLSEKVKSSKQDLDAQVVGMTQARMIVILILLSKNPIKKSTGVKATMAAEKEGL